MLLASWSSADWDGWNVILVPDDWAIGKDIILGCYLASKSGRSGYINILHDSYQ
jgi:hypothetical protein